MHLKTRIECEGIFSFRVGKIDKDGNEYDVYEPVKPFHNLITNGGLNRMGTNGDYLTYIRVGSGSTAPANTDTALVSQIAWAITGVESLSGTQSSEPYYTWRRVTKRFAEGEATGNIAEVGIGWTASSGGLFSRALVLDPDGDPITISVGADQFLDVTYELRYYPKTTDDTGSVVMTGSIGGTYDWIFRAANVTSNSGTNGWQISSPGTSMSTTSTRSALTGNIGAITSSPSGTVAIVTLTPQSYSTDSFALTFVAAAGLDVANFDIRSFLLKMGIGTYQIQFDPVIPKTNTRTLSISFTIAWGRKA
jgi:hypothetical protein